jgi:V-type H+-transporting ATPase subunit a
VRRETGIYHTLNLCSADASRKVLVAEAWAPRAAAPAARAALAGAAAAAGAAAGAVLQPVLTYDAPPTYFRTGKTTRAFQDIVDAYGIARYREANPAVFTIITFPFLFAVMFGDLGHGLLLLLVAGWLVLAEASLGCKDLGASMLGLLFVYLLVDFLHLHLIDNPSFIYRVVFQPLTPPPWRTDPHPPTLTTPPTGEMLGMLFGGRYVVLLMALFSLYTGAVYNEFFSIATTLFGNTRYACAGSPGITNPVAMMADPALCPSAHAYGLELVSPGAPHPFGVDPAWHGTRSELGFLNSMKMKMSVLMGVMQVRGGGLGAGCLGVCWCLLGGSSFLLRHSMFHHYLFDFTLQFRSPDARF